MEKYFAKICNYVARGESLPLRIILFRLICLSIVLLCIFLVMPSNMLQVVSPYLNPVVLIYTVIIYGIYRFSLRGTNLIKTAYILTLVLLNISWFINGGSTGSIGYFFLTIVIMPIVLFDRALRASMLLLTALNFTALIITEMRFPSLIVQFVTSNDRYFDLLTGFGVSTLASSVIVWLVLTSHEKKLEEYQKTENELQNNIIKLRSILKSAMDGFLMTDMEGRFLETNDAYCRMIGYSREELMTMSILDIDSIMTEEDVSFAMQSFMKREEGIRYETEQRRKDGTTINVEISTLYRPFEGGRLVNFLRDITLVKSSEDELKRHQHDLEKLVQERTQELRNSEIRFRSFVENANDIVFSLTTDGIFNYVPPNWKSAFGYEVEETIGRSFVPFVHPDDSPNCLLLLKKVLETGEKQDNIEYRVLHKNGSWIWYSANGSLIYDQISNQCSFLGVGRDVSERKRAEEEKLILEQQFLQAQKLESLGIMAGGIAHDFNNLLQSILGNMELAAKELGPDSGPREHILDAIISGKQAANLISLMLAYAGKGLIAKKELHLNEVVRENIDIIKIAATSAVSVETSLTEELPTIFADGAQIQQLVMNLITNAAEAIDKNYGVIRISTDTIEFDEASRPPLSLADKLKPGKYICLEVGDNGCGMDKEILKRLFDPFFTTKFTGRGLGMSAVLGILESHQGAISVESEPCKGTTFKVFFPVLESVLPVLDQESVSKMPATGSIQEYPLAGLVLVVDDEKPVLKVCAKMLGLCGFRVITACDGVDAVAKFRDHADEVSVVVMDLTMPNMNGITAMSEISKIKPDIKVIIASGFNKDDLGELIAEHAPAGFIRKPYSMQEIEAELRRIMSAA